MASEAYQNNGVIVIWWDESEGGDDLSRTIPEIVISPLAKGNAYASTLPLSHSSDIKTWEQVFGLPYLNNPIPVTETNNFGGYDNVATVNDLSDLFLPGTIPAPAVQVTPGQIVFNPHTEIYSQQVLVTDSGTGLAAGPLWLVLDDLSPNATLLNAAGLTTVLAPLGSPYVQVTPEGASVLGPKQSRSLLLQFENPSQAPITYNARVVDVVPTP